MKPHVEKYIKKHKLDILDICTKSNDTQAVIKCLQLVRQMAENALLNEDNFEMILHRVHDPAQGVKDEIGEILLFLSRPEDYDTDLMPV